MHKNEQIEVQPRTTTPTPPVTENTQYSFIESEHTATLYFAVAGIAVLSVLLVFGAIEAWRTYEPTRNVSTPVVIPIDIQDTTETLVTETASTTSTTSAFATTTAIVDTPPQPTVPPEEEDPPSTPPVGVAPDPVPVVPTSASGIGMSMAETLSAVNEDVLIEQLSDLAYLGVTWLRVELAWSTVQPHNGNEYQWAAFDRIVREANKQNMQLLVIVMSTPHWARSESCAYSKMCPPAHAEEFAAFTATAVKRYAPLGVHAWEVWNEPNISKFWAGGANVEQYADLLKATYPRIKEHDPSATVVLGGLSPAATGNGRIAPRNYLEELYVQHDIQGYFDALGWHPYTYPVRPGDFNNQNAWSQMADTEWSARSIMREHGDGDKEIWLTEYGAPTNGPRTIAESADFSKWPYPDHVSEEYQADLLREGFERAAEYSWAGPLFYYSYKDIGTDPSDVENFFGIIQYNESQKPAYGVLYEVAHGQ